MGWGQRAPLPCGRTRGDAEVGLVGGNVVDAMVFAGQDDVPVLQEDDPAWQPEVRVRPLVDLVGEGAKDDQAEDEALPGVQLLQDFCGWGEGGCPRAPNSCHIGQGPTASLALTPCPWAANFLGWQAPWPPSNLPHGLWQAQTPLWPQSSLLLSGQNGNKQK